ncbi:hypothetical protein [Cesiribacter andamanensis]|uniref:Magnesium citrate secondary transporter n=1 Tax=Cesiribacter andamanensis AMV16 TaxID=1279009 RepID=M7NSU4_9BACT|nr:hypothetical protein [Cesiribacter andamanensis]EMR04750.1 hypothetical protein ADICEAN_00021 [Cesiribacter andamanensis AMV16]
MLILRSPVFIACCLLFVLHQLLQKGMGVSMPFLDAYLDSFLAMPILLTLLVVERRLLFKRGNHYRLTALEAVVATSFIILISELVFPAFSSRFTADWRDVVAYSAGALLFMLTTNRFGVV